MSQPTPAVTVSLRGSPEHVRRAGRKGCNHDFLVVGADETQQQDAWTHSLVCLGDDLISYLWDGLSWIPTKNPDKGLVSGMGLNRWGNSVIDASGATIAAEVFSSYAVLFAVGPEELRLTGSFSWVDEPENGRYEILVVQRRRLIKALDALATAARDVEQSDGKLVLLHSGI